MGRITFVLLLALVGAPDEDYKPPTKDTVNEFIPKQKYDPQSGDREVVTRYDEYKHSFGDVFVARNESSYREFARAVDIGDVDGIREMRREGSIALVPARTKVLVIEFKLDPREEVTAWCVVRVLEGELKGQKGWVQFHWVKKLIPNPDYAPRKNAPKP